MPQRRSVQNIFIFFCETSASTKSSAAGDNTLSSRCNELTEECDTLRAQHKSLQLERENSQFQTAKKRAKKKRALSTLPTHNQDDDVLIIGSSSSRHLAGELSKTHEVKSTGFVYPGSKCQRLTQVIPQTKSQNQPRKPNVVVMAGGTNNIAVERWSTFNHDWNTAACPTY